MIVLSGLKRQTSQTTLARCLQHVFGGSCSPAGFNAPRLQSGDEVQQQQRSPYSTGAGRWDWSTLPSRRALFSDIPVVSSMLPNRKALTAHIFPHGIMHMPRHIPALPTAPVAAGAPGSAAVQPSSAHDANLFVKEVQAAVRKGGFGFAARASPHQRQAAAGMLSMLHSALSGSPQVHAPGMEDLHGEEGMLMVSVHSQHARTVHCKPLIMDSTHVHEGLISFGCLDRRYQSGRTAFRTDTEPSASVCA